MASMKLFMFISLFTMIFEICHTDSGELSGDTAVPPIEACYQEALTSDSALADCNNDFLDVLTNTVPSVTDFCVSSCSRCVARNYHRCRDAGGQTNQTTRFGDLGAVTFGDIIQKACAVDSEREDKFCGNLVDWDLNPEYNRSLVYANGNCSGQDDCSKPDCRDAIEALGCCAGFSHLFGVLTNVTKETFDDCNVTECLPLPFDLSPFQPCSAGSLVPPVIALSAVVVILAVGQLF